MKCFATAALAVGLGLTQMLSLIGCTQSSLDGSVGTRDSAILGGTLTPLDNPIRHSTVFILKGSSYYCSANVIAQDVLLTAAHCVSENDTRTGRALVVSPAQIAVIDTEAVDVIGRVPRVIARGLSIKAQSKYLANPQGVYNPNYDVAVVKLDSPLPAFYKPVKIAKSFQDALANQIQIAGFGLTRANQTSPDRKLRHGRITLNQQSYFPVMFGASDGGVIAIPALVANRSFASVFAYRKSADEATHCSGDSGGALYYVSNGEAYLAGVNVAHMKTGPQKTPCGPNETRISFSLVGREKYFVFQAYKELTGQELEGAAVNPGSDPATFEFHLNRTPTISRTSFIDLTQVALIRDRSSGQITAVTLESARTACSDPEDLEKSSVGIWAQNVSGTVLNGQTVLNIYNTDKFDAEKFTVVEGRMKLLGNRVRFVVLTPNGYVSADVPLMTCN